MTFKQFFENETGVPYPARQYEEVHVVLARLADVFAKWADYIKQQTKE